MKVGDLVHALENSDHSIIIKVVDGRDGYDGFSLISCYGFRWSCSAKYALEKLEVISESR